jgi:microcystin degradation protein MlrC
MSKRVLLAGLFHETNTFLNGLTALADFEILRDQELWDAEGDASPLAGALEVARACGWEVVPIIDLRAMPGATVADEVVSLFWGSFRAAVERERPRGIDGIYLVLHGAMVSESLPDVEGELLRRIRGLEGLADMPLCGVLDLHANATEAMARYSNGLVVYRENPHTDAKEAAITGARLLDRLMQSGEQAQTLWAHPPLMWPPTGVATATDPMLALETRAREIEAADPDILAVNVFGGFAFADIPDTGVSFTVVTRGDPTRAQGYLEELQTLAMTLKEVGNRLDMPLEEALRLLPKDGMGPVLLVEPADNIGAGAPGDTTGLLRALIAQRVPNVGVVINDPETVALLGDKPLGAQVSVTLGGKSGVIGAEPVALEIELLSRSDGKFTLEDRHSHLASMYGAHIEMGPCAVVRHQGITILLTSRKTPPFDLGQWRSQGIAPEQLAVIGVKAAVAHRRAYDPIAKASYTVDAPGPCASNLRMLPFQRIRRPIFPLDE